MGIDVHALTYSDTTSDTLIRGNTVAESEVGIRVGWEHDEQGRLDRLVMTGNHVRHSSVTGILVRVDVPADGGVIAHNIVQRSGFDRRRPSDHAEAFAHDGIHVMGDAELVGGLTVSGNRVVNSARLGINAPGVVDGGGNHATATGDTARCVGVTCTP